MRGFVIGLAAFITLAPLCRPAQTGEADPIFSSIPFDQWLTRHDTARMRWTVHLSDPELSAHQRLAVHLEVDVEGAELARRRGEGRFLILAQLLDGKNCVWRNHQEIALDQVPEASKGSAVFTQSFFVVPGDYRVSIAFFDSATGEHGVIERDLHVAPLRKDPLPEMWRDLPAVEFFNPDTSADRLYLPSVRGRLRLPVEARRPVDVDLLVNLTPPEALAALSEVQARNLEALIPATKVLSEIEWHNAGFHLELLDIGRRRVVYRQDSMETLDWSRARSALNQSDATTIDVRSLRNRRYSADFFVNRIVRKIGASNIAPHSPHAVIVLSSTDFFERGMDMRPIALAPRPDVKVIYIRYQPNPLVYFDLQRGPHRLYGRMNSEDELEPLLKPLAPQLFTVTTPEQFRRALAAILDEVAQL